jgi:four helix bundle protein
MSNLEANRKLEERTLVFAVTVVRFVGGFDRCESAIVIGRQLLKSGTSIGSNYREANRAESRDDFVHKTAIVLKEASETDYWLELCTRVDLGASAERAWLSQEARQLLAIFTTINHNAKSR